MRVPNLQSKRKGGSGGEGKGKGGGGGHEGKGYLFGTFGFPQDSSVEVRKY